MVLLKPKAERTTPEPRVAVVDVLPVVFSDHAAQVSATGQVQAAQQIQLIAEVSGRVVYQSEEVIPGGRLERGEVLVRLDARDYQLAVAQQESQVEQAELNLQLEKGRQAIAAREWELLGEGRSEDEAPLALRKPQLANAERAVEAARSGLAQAQLALERTALRAPYNAVVTAETVDLGQVVGPQMAIATLVGTDAFWIQVAVPVADLAHVDIPGVSAEVGSPVEITQRISGEDIVRQGRVLRLAGALDPQTRTAQLLVVVRDPLDPPDGGLPLLPGAYVDVMIAGKTLSETVRIPRRAVFDGGFVWVVTAEDTLSKVAVDIAWRTDDGVIVSGGLAEGDRVVVSPLSLPVAGMPVRIRSEEGVTISAEGEAP